MRWECLFPGKHAASYIDHVGEAYCFEEKTGLTASVAASAINNELLVFKGINCSGITVSDIAQGDQRAPDIELFVLKYFADINNIEVFTRINSGFQFLYCNGFHETNILN